MGGSVNTPNEHKNITRARFAKTVSPVAIAKLRAILEELKRKEAGRG
ncbi:hypothetical protein [Salmonella enterica]|nr:hypothetical protein [Salmonella enterica]